VGTATPLTTSSLITAPYYTVINSHNVCSHFRTPLIGVALQAEKGKIKKEGLT
jgi:hypothetical protein